MKEVSESLKMIESTYKGDNKLNLTKRLSNQCKLLKESLQSGLEPVKQLKDHLTIETGGVRKYFESNLNENEITELADMIDKQNSKCISTADQDDLNKMMKESVLIRDIFSNFETNSKEIIDSVKTSLIKDSIDFQNRILQTKTDNQELKQLLKSDLEKQLKQVIDDLVQTSLQTHQNVKTFDKNVIKAKKAYMNDLRKADCLLIIQYLEHMKRSRKRLWSKLNSILTELITNLNNVSDSSNASKGDESILKSLNDCMDKVIKFNDQSLNRAIDQTLNLVTKKLKEFDEQHLAELQKVEKQINKELADKFIQSIDSSKKIV